MERTKRALPAACASLFPVTAIAVDGLPLPADILCFCIYPFRTADAGACITVCPLSDACDPDTLKPVHPFHYR